MRVGIDIHQVELNTHRPYEQAVGVVACRADSPEPRKQVEPGPLMTKSGSPVEGARGCGGMDPIDSLAGKPIPNLDLRTAVDGDGAEPQDLVPDILQPRDVADFRQVIGRGE